MKGSTLLWLAAFACAFALPRSAAHPLALFPYIAFVAWHIVLNIRRRQLCVELAVAAILLVAATVQAIIAICGQGTAGAC